MYRIKGMGREQMTKKPARLLCLLMAGMLLLQMNAAAQESSVIPEGKDPLYLQAYFGINKSANENMPWTEFTKYPFSGGMFFAIGQEFTPLWGWRAALRWNHNKSRNVQFCESPNPWGWNNTGLFEIGRAHV